MSDVWCSKWATTDLSGSSHTDLRRGKPAPFHQGRVSWGRNKEKSGPLSGWGIVFAQGSSVLECFLPARHGPVTTLDDGLIITPRPICWLGTGGGGGLKVEFNLKMKREHLTAASPSNLTDTTCQSLPHSYTSLHLHLMVLGEKINKNTEVKNFFFEVIYYWDPCMTFAVWTYRRMRITNKYRRGLILISNHRIIYPSFS